MATRWGICSVGKISHDFSAALRTLVPEDHKVSSNIYLMVYLLNMQASQIPPLISNSHVNILMKIWRPAGV